MARVTEDSSGGPDKSFDQPVDEMKNEHEGSSFSRGGGANVDRLVKQTSYPENFIDGILQRMRQAGLWIGELVGNLDWLDEHDNLTLESYLQSQVARAHQ
jgi:hypothetical protein